MDKEQIAELLKEAGEPVGFVHPLDIGSELVTISKSQLSTERIPLFYSDQVVAAILKVTKSLESEKASLELRCSAYKNQLATAQSELDQADCVNGKVIAENGDLKDQLATAEQRVAEACAELQYDRSCSRHGYDKYEDAEAIRSGEYRKFKKKVT